MIAKYHLTVIMLITIPKIYFKNIFYNTISIKIINDKVNLIPYDKK